MDENTVFLGSLGSGSSGNAFVIEYRNESLIIDQGFSRKELLKRMSSAGFAPDKLCAALLTHEHSDHCKGSRVFCDTLELPLYTTAKTARYLSLHSTLPRHVCAFEPGESFELGNFAVRSFPLPHDAVDPVGFQLCCGEIKIGFATDFGHASENIRRELRNCDALVIESNYDREMLMNSNRDLGLKRRIFGVRGHLGNRESSELLPDLIGERTKMVMLAHISSECNTPELVKDSCDSILKAHDMLSRLHLEILTQHAPSPRFALKPGSAAVTEAEVL